MELGFLRPDYTLDGDEFAFILTHKPSGYELRISHGKDGPKWNRLSFFVPYLGEQKMQVTGRDMSDYISSLPPFPIDPNKQYVEPGAGLGALIPFLATEVVTDVTKRPIVIDNFRYDIAMQMMSHVPKLVDDEETILRNAFYRKRCSIIMDPTKVRLINLKLGEAIAAHPELIGSADVVISLYGPNRYVHTEFDPESGTPCALKRGVLDLADRLLKQGEVYHFP